MADGTNAAPAGGRRRISAKVTPLKCTVSTSLRQSGYVALTRTKAKRSAPSGLTPLAACAIADFGTDPGRANTVQVESLLDEKRAEPACGGEARFIGLGRALRAPNDEKWGWTVCDRTCSALVQSPDFLCPGWDRSRHGRLCTARRPGLDEKRRSPYAVGKPDLAGWGARPPPPTMKNGLSQMLGEVVRIRFSPPCSFSCREAQ